MQVGDICKIKAGDQIPVDGIIIKCSGVLTDESAMTGESDEIHKESLDRCMSKKEEKDAEMKNEKHIDTAGLIHALPSPILLSGSQLKTGEGWYICVAVGKNSCVGKIMDKVNQKTEATPLQMKLEVIAEQIGQLGMYVALLVVHVLIAREMIEGLIFRNFYLTEAPLENISTWVGHLTVGVTIIVVAVPEGLPLAVMISLAYSVEQMLKQQNFVKKIGSCEIMGGANNICSDKTGTLTKNEMNVTKIWSGTSKNVNY